MTAENPDAVIGPGDTVVLPEFTEPWAFMHEAEFVVLKIAQPAVDQLGGGAGGAGGFGPVGA